MDFKQTKDYFLIAAKNYRKPEENDPLEHIYHMLADGTIDGGFSSMIPAILESARVNKSRQVVMDRDVLHLLSPAQAKRFIKDDHVSLEKDWIEMLSCGQRSVKRKVEKIRKFVEARNRSFELNICNAECINRIIKNSISDIPNGRELIVAERVMPGFSVYGCLEALQLVLTELLYNAVKFSDGGDVNLFYRHSDKFYLLIKNSESSDYKIPHDIALFRKTQKLTNSESFPDDLGIGAGLDTVRQVLAKLGAKLTIQRIADSSGKMLKSAVLVSIALEYASTESVAMKK